MSDNAVRDMPRHPLPSVDAVKLTGIHHVSILVSDMERPVTWYRDQLGLTEVKRPSSFVTPVRWFELRERQLHLIPNGEPDAVSARHFALHADDCDATRQTLQARGVAIQETVPIAGAKLFVIADPDGNNIEITLTVSAAARGRGPEG